MTGAPIAAAFCTISTETRLVDSTRPVGAPSRRAERAGELVERVVAADVLAQRTAHPVCQKAAAWTARAGDQA